VLVSFWTQDLLLKGLFWRCRSAVGKLPQTFNSYLRTVFKVTTVTNTVYNVVHLKKPNVADLAKKFRVFMKSKIS